MTLQSLFDKNGQRDLRIDRSVFDSFDQIRWQPDIELLFPCNHER